MEIDSPRLGMIHIKVQRKPIFRLAVQASEAGLQDPVAPGYQT